MKCREAEDGLQDYIDGELDPEKRGRIDFHLKECPRCSEKFAKAQNLVNLLSVEEVELPPFFQTKLLARVEREKKRERVFGLAQVAWASSFILVLMTGIFLIFYFRTSRVPKTPSLAGRAKIEQPKVVIPPTRREERIRKGMREEKLPSVEIVSPEEEAIVKNGEIDICAAFYPSSARGKIRLLLDDRDVTSTAELTSDYIMYSPTTPLTSGYHLVTVEVEGGKGSVIETNAVFFVL